MVARAKLDTLRSLAYTGISGTYAAVGSAFAYNARIICITNTTDADMIFSDDNTVSAGKLFVAKGSFKLFDLTSNIIPQKDDSLELSIGTIMYVKQSAAPSSGSVYVEVIYGQ